MPVRILFEYFEGDHPLSEFLEDFPSVTKAQAIAVLAYTRDHLIAVPLDD